MQAILLLVVSAVGGFIVQWHVRLQDRWGGEKRLDRMANLAFYLIGSVLTSGLVK
jgi:hypothetical protein